MIRPTAVGDIPVVMVTRRAEPSRAQAEQAAVDGLCKRSPGAFDVAWVLVGAPVT